MLCCFVFLLCCVALPFFLSISRMIKSCDVILKFTFKVQLVLGVWPFCSLVNTPPIISVMCFINPWHTCAMRVNVVGLSVCLLSHISPLELVFILKILSRTQWATEVKIFVGFSLKLLCCRDPVLPPLNTVGHFPACILLCFQSRVLNWPGNKVTLPPFLFPLPPSLPPSLPSSLPPSFPPSLPPSLPPPSKGPSL